MLHPVQRTLTPLPLIFALAACSGGPGDSSTEESGGMSSATGDSPAPGEGMDYTFESLDVSKLAKESDSWCTPPAFSPAGYTGLDQVTLAQLLADYTSGWMVPLHESLLGLNEVDLFDSAFETVLASVETGCNYRDDADLESLPPPEGELLDPERQQSVRDDVSKVILDAQLLSEGEAVRLVVRSCESCAEGMAQYPLFLTARLTNDGVLVAEVELGEEQTWVRTLYITPNAAVVQAPLAQATAWQADVVAATPDVDDVMPDIEGTLTAVIRKDNAGGTSATIGVSSLSFDAQPGQTQTVWGQALNDCVGFHIGISGATGEAQFAAELGNFELTIPGSVNCDVEECGQAERTENWVYTLGGISMTAEQPGPSEPENLRVNVNAQSASKARVGAKEFANGGIGKKGQGGRIGLSVDKTPEGFLVSFSPALNLGGAMTITSFSDQLRMNLPSWLQDEIFDVTFGGDPKAQVFVPARELCPNTGPYATDPTDPPPERPVEPARRDVHIKEGTLQVTRASGGDLTAGPGSCMGKTVLSTDSLTQTSDWVEAGYSCP